MTNQQIYGGRPCGWTLTLRILMLFASLLLLGPRSFAQIPCAVVDFDGDIPGQAPATSRWNQPTSLRAVGGTTILVQSNVNGLNTQPVEIIASAPSEFGAVNITVGPVSSGIVRVEATIALDRLVDAVLLHTSVSQAGARISDLHATSAPLLTDHVGAPVGTYIPNQPFRVRMDVDMTTNVYSVAIDNELDGFGDDTPVANLPFVNQPNNIPWLDNVGAALSVFSNIVTGASVAYDDIDVTCPGIEVAIDIRPNNSKNQINVNLEGVIPVAILSTAEFDAPARVDRSSLRLGPTGRSLQTNTEQSCPDRPKDVNHDGLPDLVCGLWLFQTGFQSGDTTAVLRGKTLDNITIQGVDSIQTVP